MKLTRGEEQRKRFLMTDLDLPNPTIEELELSIEEHEEIKPSLDGEDREEYEQTLGLLKELLSIVIKEETNG